MLLAALAVASGCGGTAPAAHDEAASVASPAFRLTAAAAARPASAQRLADEEWSGGRLSLPAGEAVTVYVSDAYSDDPGAARRWADYLGGLLHGSELNVLKAYIATPAEVLDLCFARALGCYGNDTMISIGEPVNEVSAEEVVRHEYGHHVAANRQNPPWAAIDWGTKRWASAADVCARVAGQTAFPGDEGLFYSHNPGEAFAEAYRVLNEVRSGGRSFSWTLADPSFSPDERELAAIEDDVLRPWAPSPQRLIVGRLRDGSRTWTHSIATPLDGDLELSLRMPLGAGHTLELLDSRRAVLARGLWSGSAVRTLRYRICGQRSVLVRVGRAGGALRFQVRANVP